MLVVMKARKWLMNDILELECILKRERYPSIYKFGWLMIIIIILFLYVINTYKYQSYYITKGIVKDNFIELLVPINDLKYITDNKHIIFDGKKYRYNVNEISKDIYVDDKYNNYKYIYIDIPGLSSVNNYVYQVKLEKENKSLANYLLEYIKGGENGVN